MEIKEIIKDCSNNFEKVDLLVNYANGESRIRPERSIDILREAISISKSVDYKAGRARAKLCEGICQRQLSNFDAAVESFNESLKIFKEISDINGEIRTLNSIGNVYYSLSDYNNAIGYFDSCVEKLQVTGDRAYLAIVYSNIGLVYQEMNNLSSALASYYEALNIYSELNKAIPHSLYNNIGIVYQEIGDCGTSVQYFRKALELEEQEGNLIFQCSSLGNMGISYIKSGNHLNGVTYLGEALIIAKLTGNRQTEASIYNHLGNAYKVMKSYPLAVDYKLKALRHDKEIGDRSSVAGTLCQLGKIYFELNDHKASKASYLESLEIVKEISDTINEVNIYIGLAELYNKLGKIDKLEYYLDKAEKLSISRNADKELMKIHTMYNDCYRNCGQFEKAAYHLEQSRIYSRKMLEFDEEKKIRNILLGKIFNDEELTKDERNFTDSDPQSSSARNRKTTGVRA